MTMIDAIETARKEWQKQYGNCAMCSAGDTPKDGLHRNKYRCGNAVTCTLCINAGMQHGDQCAACGRIEMSAT